MKVSTKQKALNYLEEKKAAYKIQHAKDRAEHGEMEFTDVNKLAKFTSQQIHYTNTKKYSQDLDISAECLRTLRIINGL